MTTATLAPPAELVDDPADERVFEDSRILASLALSAEVIQAGFVLREGDWSDLFRYLTAHPLTLSVLREAPQAIREVFGEVRPFLDLVADPEEGWKELFIVVPVHEPPHEAVAKLRQLDATWLVEAARRAGFAINVTVEQRV